MTVPPDGSADGRALLAAGVEHARCAGAPEVSCGGSPEAARLKLAGAPAWWYQQPAPFGKVCGGVL